MAPILQTCLWLYSIAGTLYLLLYYAGVEIVHRFAVGPLWMLMMAASCILFFLIFLAVFRKRQ